MSSRLVLGMDAGGTHTRAVVADRHGTVLALARGAPGNPEAHGPEAAFCAVRETVANALSLASATVRDLDQVVLAQAGDNSSIEPQLRQLFSDAGAVNLDLDLLAMFASATYRPSGGAVLSGTGSIAGRFVDRKAVRCVGGAGWLVGDAGSGFAIGRAVARAAVSDLDGYGPRTTLTARVMAHEEISDWGYTHADAERLARRLRGQLPILLARFAPLAFSALDSDQPDAVAAQIVQDARDAIADLITAIDLAPSEPLVVGGSVLVQGLLPTSPTDPDRADRLATLLGEHSVLRTRDGAVGAVILALEAAQVTITPELYSRVLTSAAQFATWA